MAEIKDEVLWHKLLVVAISVLSGVLGWALLALIAGYDKHLAEVNAELDGAHQQRSELRAANHSAAVAIAALQTELRDYRHSGDKYMGDHDKFRTGLSECREALSAKREKIIRIDGRLNVLDQQVLALTNPGGPGKRYTSDDAARDRATATKGIDECKRASRRNEIRIDRNDERLDRVESQCCSNAIKP